MIRLSDQRNLPVRKRPNSNQLLLWLIKVEKYNSIQYQWLDTQKNKHTVSAQIGGRRLIKKLGFYGEILLNKMLSN